jgi:brefeldin A-inhibited guanine nucleotide-exchange protein
MAYGYIRVTIKDIEDPQKRLMDKVIDIIGDCFDFTDDSVQLQIIKAFLTAVSSTHCEVHDQSLMNTVRACFNIYLISRNKVNQATAKATLQQMLDIIFQRFEVKYLFSIKPHFL